MKKIISFVLVLCLVFLYSCANTTNISTEEYQKLPKQFGYFGFENLTWGMSKEDCRKALGLKKAEFTQGSSDDTYEIYTAKCKVYDKDSTVIMTFGKKQKDNHQLGLYAVNVYINGGMRLADLEQHIKTALADNGFSYTRYDDSPIIYRNNKKIKDIEDSNLKNKTLELMTVFQQKGGENTELDWLEFYVDPNNLKNATSVGYNGTAAAVLYQAYQELK